MKGIILAGGLGTRLRPLTANRPKPLLPILNVPFFKYQLDILQRGGVKETVLAVGQFVPEWRKAIKKCAPRGMKVSLVQEKKPLGTGGAIKWAYQKGFRNLKKGSSEPVVVLNGDVFLNLDATALAKFALTKGFEGALSIVRVPDASAFGLIDFDSTSKIKRFLEKPKRPKPGWINAGAYLLRGEIIDSFPKGPHSVERDVFPRLIREKKALGAFKLRGYWNDIGTLSNYIQAHQDLIDKNLYWTNGRGFEKNGAPGVSSQGAKARKSLPKFIQSRRQVKLGKHLKTSGFSVIGPRVSVGSGCVFKDVILMENARVGDNVTLEKVVVGEGAIVEAGSVIRGPVAVGDRSVLTSYSRIGR